MRDKWTFYVTPENLNPEVYVLPTGAVKQGILKSRPKKDLIGLSGLTDKEVEYWVNWIHYSGCIKEPRCFKFLITMNNWTIQMAGVKVSFKGLWLSWIAEKAI